MTEIKINGDNFRLLINRREIMQQVEHFAERIIQDYPNNSNPPLLLLVLNGGIYLGVDLSRALENKGFNHLIDTVGLQSYSPDNEGGEVTFTSMPRLDLGGRDIIVVEDIIDRGETMNFLHNYLTSLDILPGSIKYLSLFMKENHGPLAFDVKYLAWSIGWEWVIGNGMDTDNFWRGLSDVFVKVTQ